MYYVLHIFHRFLSNKAKTARGAHCIISCLDFDTTLQSSFLTDYNKTYANDEEFLLRSLIFRHNFDMMNAHNNRFDNGEVGWKLGISEDFDWTTEEQEEWHGGALLNTRTLEDNFKSKRGNITRSQRNLPESWNWIDQGGLTDVKNQVFDCYLITKLHL